MTLSREEPNPSRPVALLVGASGAIGKEIATRLRSSFSLVGIDRMPPPVGWIGDFIEIDLSCVAAVTEAIQFVDSCSPEHLDAAVFANGSYSRIPLGAYTHSLLQATLWDNFLSAFYITQHILLRMRAAGKGRLVYITSQAAAAGGTDPGYAASKAALQALMKSVAREYGGLGIRCNSVSPGPVDTPMANAMGTRRKAHYRKVIPIGRLCTAPEVAEAVRFLLNPEVDGINGHTLDVDGGLLRR